MKKILSFAIMLVALVGFTACEDDSDFYDPDYKGVYSYVVPCLQWNASIDEVRAYMKGVKGWNSSMSQIGNYNLVFRQEKTRNDIYYTFHNGKLARATVTWYCCQEDFDKMREEYASKLGFTWEQHKDDENCYYWAISHDLHCDISLQYGTLNGVRQMGITFDYAKSY